MTKYSKEVLREARSPTLPINTQLAMRGIRRKGGRAVYNPIQDRMGPFSGKAYKPSNRAMPSKPSTDVVTKSGISGNIGNLGFLAKTVRYLGNKILGVGVGIGGVWIGFKLFVKESKEFLDKLINALPLSDEHKEWLKANMLLVVMSVGLLVGSAEAARRITPRIMKVLRNRRISAEIGEALDAGDETMARTILLDAIEDENINLSAIRRRLGDDDYERLYRDFL
jgi:hypothetical protein